MTGRPKIVVLGMMTKMPVGGVVWQTLHYLLGFDRLGFDTYYVEAHARTPSMLMRNENDDGGALAAGFIDRVMRRFDRGDRWGYQALHADGRCYGMSQESLRRLYASAELIVNLHGGTTPRPEHSATGRLVYVETDPVQLQVELRHGLPATVEFLEHHCAFFTFGENWGAPDCRLPTTARFEFRPTRQPVCMDLWPPATDASGRCFTTIGNWRQRWRDVALDGQVYTWTKDVEFEKFLDLPRLTGQEFELALSGYETDDKNLLDRNGWRVVDALPFSLDADEYREYIRSSLGEFTVAKDQNVRLRSGWFSDRSATYLAAGRPVVTQDTGFANVLPTGVGLHAFTTLDEAAAAVGRVCSRYGREQRAAHEVARECFDSDVVLGSFLSEVGLASTKAGRRRRALDWDLPLQPASRRPLRLAEGVESRVRTSPIPFTAAEQPGDPPDVSVVVVSHDKLALTRLCIESILENTAGVRYETVVVDNGSQDGSRSYLLTLERRVPHLRLIRNSENVGFPRACNQGLEAARGQVLVLLNNDTVVPPGWLTRLVAHAGPADVGLVGPVTNRIGNEAEVEVSYRTYGQFLRAAHERAASRSGQSFEIPMPAMFCLAFRREVHERLGPLDQRYGIGTLEDDDYAEAARRAGYRLLCAEDVLVHHFGEGSFGDLFPSGEHSRLIEENRRRFEQKWGIRWQPYRRRQSGAYRDLRERVRRIVTSRVPDGSQVIVVSHGDDDLVAFGGAQGRHFPQTTDGVYAGHHPADSTEAIEHLEALRAKGGRYFVLPSTGFWWLEHYAELARHLDSNYDEVFRDDACIVFELEHR
jgi:GT2 family glycosyltransferase